MSVTTLLLVAVVLGIVVIGAAIVGLVVYFATRGGGR
jgi:hypothetical protein